MYVVSVERHSERILVLKMVLGDCLLNVFAVYAPHSGKSEEEKERFWKEVFHLVSCRPIPQKEMVVLAVDMNGHIGSRPCNVGYDGTHGGFGHGCMNADGSSYWSLQMGICSTLFTKQEAKLVTYVDGPVKSTVDYIMVRQKDKAKVRNVKVIISSEECVPKHKLLVMDMWFKARKSWRRKFEPSVRVWKLKEEKTCEEYACMVRDKVEETTWKGLGVNDQWQQMKGLVLETAQDMCRMTKGPCRLKETWWWNEEGAEAVREKKIKYRKWKKENTKEAKKE